MKCVKKKITLPFPGHLDVQILLTGCEMLSCCCEEVLSGVVPSTHLHTRCWQGGVSAVDEEAVPAWLQVCITQVWFSHRCSVLHLSLVVIYHRVLSALTGVCRGTHAQAKYTRYEISHRWECPSHLSPCTSRSDGDLHEHTSKVYQVSNITHVKTP